MIPKNTNNQLVFEMIGLDIRELVDRNTENAKEKWLSRKEQRSPQLVPKAQVSNYLKGIPNEWCLILKQQFSLCPKCKNCIRNEEHMKMVHNINIYSYQEAWTEIKEYHRLSEEQQAKKNPFMSVKRIKYLEHWRPALKMLNEDIYNKFKLVFKVN